MHTNTQSRAHGKLDDRDQRKSTLEILKKLERSWHHPLVAEVGVHVRAAAAAALCLGFVDCLGFLSNENVNRVFEKSYAVGFCSVIASSVIVANCETGTSSNGEDALSLSIYLSIHQLSTQDDFLQIYDVRRTLQSIVTVVELIIPFSSRSPRLLRGTSQYSIARHHGVRKRENNQKGDATERM